MAVTTFAAIDIGSYEVSMKIFEMSRRIGFREINDVRYQLELGRGTYAVGRLEMETVDELCEILNDFKRMMADFGVESWRACATSSLRELKNPTIILEQIYQRTGIRVEILSNAEQHFLGYKSIAAIESGFKKAIQKGTAILDIGGGNLQVSLFDKVALLLKQSIRMGSLRIRQRLKDLENTTPHYDRLVEEFIRNDLMSFQRLYLKDKEISNLILMGDFLTDTIFQEKSGENIITKTEFLKKYDSIVNMSDYDLADSMGLEPEYASLIIPNMVIIRNFIELFQAEALWIPGVSLLDGIAYDYAEKNKYLKSAHNFENDILVASRNIARRYSSGKDHLTGTCDLALDIFDSTKKIHGMGKRERLLLQISVLLHDCGKYISMTDVAEYSYQIIMATEIIGLSTEERQVIASVVRYNTKEFGCYEEINRETAMSREEYLLTAKLAAILRLANAMDRSHYQKVKALNVKLKDRTLYLIIDSVKDVSLELGLLKDKTEFFESVFGIQLLMKRKGRA